MCNIHILYGYYMYIFNTSHPLIIHEFMPGWPTYVKTPNNIEIFSPRWMWSHFQRVQIQLRQIPTKMRDLLCHVMDLLEKNGGLMVGENQDDVDSPRWTSHKYTYVYVCICVYIYVSQLCIYIVKNGIGVVQKVLALNLDCDFGFANGIWDNHHIDMKIVMSIHIYNTYMKLLSTEDRIQQRLINQL